jgi:hypothetical protein
LACSRSAQRIKFHEKERSAKEWGRFGKNMDDQEDHPAANGQGGTPKQSWQAKDGISPPFLPLIFCRPKLLSDSGGVMRTVQPSQSCDIE